MKLSELITKDVINEQDGLKLGKVYDLEIDPASGKVNFIKVKDGFRILSFLKNNNDIEIPWNKIIKIGNDVIIVDTYLNVNGKKEEK